MREDFAKSGKAVQDVNERVVFEFFLNPCFSLSHMLMKTVQDLKVIPCFSSIPVSSRPSRKPLPTFPNRFFTLGDLTWFRSSNWWILFLVIVSSLTSHSLWRSRFFLFLTSFGGTWTSGINVSSEEDELIF